MSDAPSPVIQIEPQGFPGTESIVQSARAAIANVGLDPSIRRLSIVLDAPEFEEGGFWMLERDPDGGRVATIYGSPRDVLALGARDEKPDVVLDPEQLLKLPDDRLDRLRVDRWLHRNLLQLDDLVTGRVDPEHVPPRQSAALQAVWDVWTDGRLRARQNPGLTQAERRRIFFRVFATQGLLLPRHWDVYHRLWAGEYADQDGLLAALSTLPRAG